MLQMKQANPQGISARLTRLHLLVLLNELLYGIECRARKLLAVVAVVVLDVNQQDGLAAAAEDLRGRVHDALIGAHNRQQGVQVLRLRAVRAGKAS